jgi:hypothetical protein
MKQDLGGASTFIPECLQLMAIAVSTLQWYLPVSFLRLSTRLQNRSWHGQETTDGNDDDHIFQ